MLLMQPSGTQIICELVGTLILNKLKNVFQNNTFGLYRDDRLAVIKGLSGPEIEKLKKCDVKTSKDCELNITIEANLHTVSYLDVTFDLRKGTYLPYRKSDKPPVYTNSCSNHQPTVIKQLPKLISKRLSDLSSNREIFEKIKPVYRDALNKSRFQEKLSYTSAQNKNNKNGNKQRKRKIIWHKQRYSADSKKNIGKTFLNLIKYHFPKKNKLHKIFNKNTVKVSYSCMSSISSIISGHNKNLLNPNVTQYGCNCQIREDCPLQNQCLTPNIIYRADVNCRDNKDHKFCFRIAQTPFNERFRNNNRDFNHEQYIKNTELSKYIWSLKDAGTPCNMNWSIVEKVKGSTKTNYCPLCLTEKCHLIEYFINIRLLNKKSKCISACRHQSKLLLKNLKRNDRMD